MHTRTLIVLAATLLAASTVAQFAAPAAAQSPSGAAAARALVAKAADPALTWGPCPPLFAPGCRIAVLHGDPSKPNADVFLRVPSGYTIAPHSHTSAERMILVTGRLEVQYVDAPKAVLAVGDYAYGPPGVPHVGRCVGKESCTLFIAFEQPVDATPFAGEIREHGTAARR